MTVGEAIHLLHMHKNIVHGAGKAPGLPPRRMRLAEVQASILRKIEAIERGAAFSDEQRATDEAGYAARRWRGDG